MPSPPAVLLVDDDPTHQLIALSMFRHLGIEADTVTDGSAAVARVAARAYDVVILGEADDAAELRAAVRTRRPAGALRILAMTEHAEPAAAERLRAAGFDGTLRKPFSVRALEAVVRAPLLDPPRPSVAPPSLVDNVRARVRALLGEDDEDFVAELSEAFAGSSRQALEDAAEAHGRGDAPGLASAAHALKGSASNVGLTALTEAWAAVEDHARAGATVEMAAAYPAAVAETERALAELAPLLGG